MLNGFRSLHSHQIRDTERQLSSPLDQLYLVVGLGSVVYIVPYVLPSIDIRKQESEVSHVNIDIMELSALFLRKFDLVVAEVCEEFAKILDFEF